MKNTILIFTSIFLLLTSFHFKNTAQDIEVVAAISTDKMNVFHIGFDNPISVAISGVPIEDTKVSIDKGKITPSNKKGNYNVRVFEEGETTIYLEGTDKQGNIVKSASTFRVKRIPDPTAMLGNKKGGLIGIREMKAQRGIIAVLLNFDISAFWNVLSYKLERVRVGEPSILLENKGAQFSEEIRQLIQKTKVGDFYFFTEIMVKGPGGFVREIQPISFEIKE